jgi:hypothetical protein
MSSDVQRRETRRTASFHDASARETYARHFGTIGISAVAAGAGLASRKAERSTPRLVDIPAILRAAPHDE